jgi:acyl-homoserine lactone acylase PvdQ
MRIDWRMKLTGIALVLCLGMSSGLSAQPLPGTGPDEGKTVMYRDTWGVPHIYAPTVAQGMFAMGWAQAEDRPEEVLKNLLRGIGEASLFEGERGIQSDRLSRMWRHYELAKSGMDTIAPNVREHMEAYAEGVNAWYAAHPEDVPVWWGDRKVDAAMVVAFSRFFLYSWSIDDGFGDLSRAGIRPESRRSSAAPTPLPFPPHAAHPAMPFSMSIPIWPGLALPASGRSACTPGRSKAADSRSRVSPISPWATAQTWPGP